MDTKAGSDLVRGISGGERKRISIAEIVLSGGALQCWDNSTRGLDSASAFEFVKSLKAGCKIFSNPPFGPGVLAKRFFYDMGFGAKPRQPTLDFLSSLTQPSERIIRPG
jgi:hypothetical protein